MNLLFLLGVLGGSALLSGISVLLSIRLSYRWAVLDHPDMARKTQSAPIPNFGGVAVALAFLFAALGALWISGRSELAPEAIGIFLPALGAALLGFFDDRRHLNPYFRLVCQALLAYLAWVLGIRIDLTGIPALDLAFFIIWVVAVVNALNLLDNSDGLAASTVVIASLGAAIVALLSGQLLVPPLAAAVAGAALGFLRHNWFPARVYLGDAGAYFLGLLLALLVVELAPADAPQWAGIAIAVLLLLLPLADMAFVIARRLAAGIHPFTAGRDHMSHVLQQRGRTVPQAVRQLQIVEIIGVLSAIAIAWSFS